MEEQMLKGLILGIIVGFLLVAAGIHLYFATGQAPVATSAAPMPFERRYAHIALDAYLNKLPHPEPQTPADEPNYLAGAEVYKQNCAVCHGLPGMAKTSIATGMFPKPPQLWQGVGVTDDEAWETYWKVENGIRMTGMPGFKGQLNETQIWQVSVLLNHGDKIPASVKTALASNLASGVSTPGVLPVVPSPVLPPQKPLVQP
jgi:mono/diheme cytochrome c family protein